MMFDARVIQAIETNILLRGNGKNNPYRRVKQYWSFDGELLAESDPLVNRYNCFTCGHQGSERWCVGCGEQRNWTAKEADNAD